MTAILMGLTILFYGLGQILLKIGLLKLGPMSIDRLQSPSFIWQLVATPQENFGLLLNVTFVGLSSN